MKRRWRIWLLLVLLLFVAASILVPPVRWRLLGWSKGEAFYQGRPTTYWREQVRVYTERMAELERRGAPGSVPIPPAPWSGVWDLFRQPDPIDVLGVGLGLGYVGQSGVPIPDPAQAVVLCELVDDDDDAIASYAIGILKEMGPECKIAVPALVKLLSHPRIERRREAGLALAVIEPAGPDAVPAPIRALEEDDAPLNSFAACALKAIGSPAREAVPVLVRVMQSERAGQRYRDDDKRSLTVGEYAADALEAIDPEAAAKAGVK
jgi:hypothetical protein